MVQFTAGHQEANAIDWKIRRKGFVLWSLGLRQERKLSVAHGVLSRVDPTRGCSHFWRSPCAIEGETPWPPCKSGPSRRHRLFFAAGSLGTASSALTPCAGTFSLSMVSPLCLSHPARPGRHGPNDSL